VNSDQVAREVQYARRMFADNGWPVIDVSRRSIEETAAAVINLYNERQPPAVRKRPDPPI
jgi:regulator of PEP synthase PpsR (kinase-PPPase family)